MADAQDAVSAKNKNSWMSFIKSTTSFNGDLSSMTAPAFILSTTSLTEFSAYWAEMPTILVAPVNEPDDKKRAMLVLKWFLSTLKQQYSSRNEKLGSEKKPLNPFLGELFLGHWDDEAGRTELISEQVSHHPPVTAYSIKNKQHGVHLQGYNAQKASFRSTINVRQVGHAVLHLDRYNEDYLITLPALHIESLILGTPYVELDGVTHIVSSSGYTSEIEYSGKGWVSGKQNSFTAQMYHSRQNPRDKKEVIYTVDGQWNDKFTIKDANKKMVDTYNAKAMTKTPLTVLPIEEQDPLESRRAWRKVADAILAKDMNATTAAKSVIENQQRELRRKEREEGRDWQRRYFKRVEQSAVVETLMAFTDVTVEKDQTDGIWETKI